jgi:hypothetical protein
MAVMGDVPGGQDRLAVLVDRVTIKLMYEPVAVLVSFVGGMVASTLFIRIWRVLSRGQDAPAAMDDAATWAAILPAAAVHGVVFGVVKALTDRSSAKAFQRMTGVWPGKQSSAHPSG